MRTNEAPWDRIARFVFGLAAVAAGATLLEPGAGAAILSIVGSILVVTGLVGWCPLYDVLGIRSGGKAER